MNKQQAENLIADRGNDGAEKILKTHLDDAGVALNHVLATARFASAGDDPGGWTVIAIPRGSVSLIEGSWRACSRNVLLIRNGVVDLTSVWTAEQAEDGRYKGFWTVCSD